MDHSLQRFIPSLEKAFPLFPANYLLTELGADSTQLMRCFLNVDFVSGCGRIHSEKAFFKKSHLIYGINNSQLCDTWLLQSSKITTHFHFRPSSQNGRESSLPSFVLYSTCRTRCGERRGVCTERVMGKDVSNSRHEQSVGGCMVVQE